MTHLACSVLESSGEPAKRYEQVVDVLEQQGWLTPMQASLLATLATGSDGSSDAGSGLGALLALLAERQVLTEFRHGRGDVVRHRSHLLDLE